MLEVTPACMGRNRAGLSPELSSRRRSSCALLVQARELARREGCGRGDGDSRASPRVLLVPCLILEARNGFLVATCLEFRLDRQCSRGATGNVSPSMRSKRFSSRPGFAKQQIQGNRSAPSDYELMRFNTKPRCVRADGVYFPWNLLMQREPRIETSVHNMSRFGDRCYP